MNIDPEKFTEMGVGAIREMQEIARRNGQQEVDSWHLLGALVDQEEGIVPTLFDEMGIGSSAVQLGLRRELDNLPKISGNVDTARSYASSTLSEVIEKAQVSSKEMEDDYVSTEHLLLGLVEVGKPAALGRFLKNFGLGKKSIREALKKLRGGQRVTTKTPENTLFIENTYRF